MKKYIISLMILVLNINVIFAESSSQIVKDFLNQTPLKIINLGNIVNSEYEDYGPSISIDGKKLYYVSNKNGSILHSNKKNSHDIWISEKNNLLDTLFSKSYNLDNRNLNGLNGTNTSLNEGTCSIYNDKIMYFSGCNRPNGIGSCDLYKSELIDGNWSTPIILNRKINTQHFESHPSINSLNNRIYFVSTKAGPNSDGKDIIKNFDIWYSDWNYSKNEWDEAINIEEINTSGSEGSPFITADGLTLIFTSDNILPNYGGTDFYYSTFDISTQKWSTPLNLGSNINTENDELFMSIPASGDVAYISSRSNSLDLNFGKLDLYAVYRSYDKENLLLNNKNSNFVDFIYYPNPIESTVTIKLLENNQNIDKIVVTILNLEGKVIINKEFEKGNDEMQINFDGFTSGIYYIRIGDILKTLIKY